MKHPHFQLGEMVLVVYNRTDHGYGIVTNISDEVGEFFYSVKFIIENPSVKTFTSYHSSELTKTFYSATMGYRELIMNLEKC